MTDSSRHLPYKQKLVLSYKPKMNPIVERFPSVAYCIDDEDLNSSIGEVLEKLAFEVFSHSNDNLDRLTEFLEHSLKNNQLVLIHYRTRMDKSTIMDVLRRLIVKNSNLPFQNIVPVFKSNPTSSKQRKLFHVLGGFDVHFAIFLTPQADAEMNLRELLGDLSSYLSFIDEKAEFPDPDELSMSAKETSSSKEVEEYNKLLRNAEALIDEEPERAIEIFSQAIEMKPDFGALISRGDAYYSIKEYPAALGDYRTASSLEREQATPLAKIGVCCFALTKEASARGDMEAVRKWSNKGIDALGDAEQLVEKMHRENATTPEKIPGNPYASIISAIAEADLRIPGIEVEAEMLDGIVEKVMSRAGSVNFYDAGVDVDSRIDYATLLARKGDYDEAEKIFRDIIDKNPEAVGPAFNNFAVELRKNGENGKAFSVYNELLKRDIPDRDIVAKNLATAGRKYGETLRQELKYEDAVEVYDSILKAINKNDGMEWVLCDLATVHLESQDQASASARLMEAFYINPQLAKLDKFKSDYGNLSSLRKEMVMKLTEGTPGI